MSLGTLIVLVSSCNSESQRQEKQETLPKLSVGIQVSPAMTLVMVAEDKHYFDSAGVDVEIKEFTAGKFALQAFLGGSLDVAISGEVPVTLSTLRGEKFRVIGQVVERTINECRVVVRKEEGLLMPRDYFLAKKRKLATSFGGGPEFYTYNFLKKNNIPADQVELISQKPEDMPAALVSGSVDAISIFDPQAFQAEQRMGDAGLSFKDDEIYSELYVIDVREEKLAEKSAELQALLQGLHDAEDFIEQYPEEAKAILMKYTQLDKETVDGVWDNFVFKVAINDLFINYTTAQAKWAIEKGDYPQETPIPDFRTVLATDLLQQVDAQAVALSDSLK
ncbi:MAG: NrtA/SsuA/CpmA family ABC transporter substrate-binding protein [Bacteroidota bacterium]